MKSKVFPEEIIKLLLTRQYMNLKYLTAMRIFFYYRSEKMLTRYLKFNDMCDTSVIYSHENV